MFKSKLSKKAVGLFFIIAILDLMAEIFYLHWTIWWYDTILHFLSGALIALVVGTIWSNYQKIKETDKIKVIIITLLIAFSIGLLWEIFELYVGFVSFSDGVVYIRDTTSDLILDVCGGFFGILYSFKILLAEKEI